MNNSDFETIIQEEITKYFGKGKPKPNKKAKAKTAKKADGGSLKDIALKAQAAIWNLWRSRNCGPNARKLEPGEIHYACANFEGPGTRMDLKRVRDHEPYNTVDACAKTHDIIYSEIFKGLITKKIKKNEAEKMIRQADEEILRCFEESKKESGYYRAGKTGITAKLILENTLGKIPSLKKLFESSIAISPYIGSK